jgi:hypothetical protein
MSYADTYQSEIFVKSRCLDHEWEFLEELRGLLDSLGYVSQDPRRFIWQKDKYRVWLAMVDDIESISPEPHEDFLSTFTQYDVIVTDNFISRPINAHILSVPKSWFGIYSYTPEIMAAAPDRDYTLAVNRIDSVRATILLEMQQWRHLSGVQGYVNFNCASHALDQTIQQKRELWDQMVEDIKTWHEGRYDRAINDIRTLIPFRNHDLEIDEAVQRGMLNLVIETYSSDYTVALSEKIFRAIVTPRPWTVFGGQWTVARLEQLGFDCMRDTIHHKTDTMKSNEHKIREYVRNAADHWKQLVWEEIEERCELAVKFNRRILESKRQRWANDRPNFLKHVEMYLQKRLPE